MKSFQEILRFLTCGAVTESDDCGLETSMIFDNELNIESMLKQSTKIMENLKVQTDCYKAEIDALRSEIVRLRLENTTRSISTRSNSTSTDSGCSTGGTSSAETIGSLGWMANLDETLEKVSQNIPVFIDLPIDV